MKRRPVRRGQIIKRTFILLAAPIFALGSSAWADRPLQQKSPEPTAPTQPLPPAATDLERRTLNFSGSRSPSFIPEKVLATQTLQELGFSDGERSRVIGLQVDAQPPGCQWRMPAAKRRAFASFSIEDAIASEPVAFVGTVKRIIPGLSNWRMFDGRTAHVEVVHIPHGDFAPALVAAPNSAVAANVAGDLLKLPCDRGQTEFSFFHETDHPGARVVSV